MVKSDKPNFENTSSEDASLHQENFDGNSSDLPINKKKGKGTVSAIVFMIVAIIGLWLQSVFVLVFSLIGFILLGLHSYSRWHEIDCETPSSISLKLFAFTALLFIVAVFPYTGVILMCMLAFFLPIITINLGFLMIMVDVAQKSLPRVALLLPIIYFGGYFVVAIVSNEKSAQIANEITVKNSALHIPFNAQQQELVFRGSSQSPAVDFLKIAAIPVVFDNETFNPRFHQEACRLVGANIISEEMEREKDQRQLLTKIGIVTRAASDDVFQKDGGIFCNWEEPSKPVYNVTVNAPKRFERIIFEPKSFEEFLLGETKEVSTVTTPEGLSYNIFGGKIERLSFLPMPVMGCVLNDMPSEWLCFAGFWRSTVLNIDEDATYRILAKSLGIPIVPPNKRPLEFTDPAWVDVKINEAKGYLRRDAEKRLDTFLTNQTTYKDIDLSDLHDPEETSFISSRLDSILAVLEKSRDNKWDGDDLNRLENEREVANLIASLPTEVFEKNLNKFIEFFADAKLNQANLQWGNTTHPILNRLKQYPQARAVLNISDQKK